MIIFSQLPLEISRTINDFVEGQLARENRKKKKRQLIELGKIKYQELQQMGVTNMKISDGVITVHRMRRQKRGPGPRVNLTPQDIQRIMADLTNIPPHHISHPNLPWYKRLFKF